MRRMRQYWMNVPGPLCLLALCGLLARAPEARGEDVVEEARPEKLMLLPTQWSDKLATDVRLEATEQCESIQAKAGSAQPAKGGKGPVIQLLTHTHHYRPCVTVTSYKTNQPSGCTLTIEYYTKVFTGEALKLKSGGKGGGKGGKSSAPVFGKPPEHKLLFVETLQIPELPLGKAQVMQGTGQSIDMNDAKADTGAKDKKSGGTYTRTRFEGYIFSVFSPEGELLAQRCTSEDLQPLAKKNKPADPGAAAAKKPAAKKPAKKQ